MVNFVFHKKWLTLWNLKKSFNLLSGLISYLSLSHTHMQMPNQRMEFEPDAYKEFNPVYFTKLANTAARLGAKHVGYLRVMWK